jgi:CTP synthase (UTP-ammonia lyase)
METDLDLGHYERFTGNQEETDNVVLVHFKNLKLKE